MNYQNKNQQPVEEQDEKRRPNDQFGPQRTAYNLPNSFMQGLLMAPPPGIPNSVMREMLDPQIFVAESEANRLSAGIKSGTPNSVRKEMGSRLGADFSSVHFHSDSESIRKGESIGARAWTQGGDIYFGRGGFSPGIAAHELVHTVQQNAASGHVSQSVPTGTIQRWPFHNKLTDSEMFSAVGEYGIKNQPSQFSNNYNATESLPETILKDGNLILGGVKDAGETFDNAWGLENLGKLGRLSDHFSQKYDPGIEGSAGLLGALTGAVNTGLNFKKTWDSFSNLDEGENAWDTASTSLDTISSAASTGSGLFKFGKNFSKLTSNSGILKLGKFGGSKLIPWLNIATGASDAISGGIKAVKGGRAVSRIKKQTRKLSGNNSWRLQKLFEHGQRISELKRTGGIFQAISGGLSFGTGIATMGGPLAPLAAGILGAVSGVTGLLKKGYEYIKKQNLVNDALAEELGYPDWKTAVADEKKEIKRKYGKRITDRDAERIILQAHGIQEGTRETAFKKINQKRAEELINEANSGSVNAKRARKMIEALGVKQVGGQFTAGAKELLAKKLE